MATTSGQRCPRSGADRVAHITTITKKAERNAATDEATDAIVAELAETFEGREREIKAAVRSPHQAELSASASPLRASAWMAVA